MGITSASWVSVRGLRDGGCVGRGDQYWDVKCRCRGSVVLIAKAATNGLWVNSCFVPKFTYICIFAQNSRYFMNIMSMEREQQAVSANYSQYI